MNDEDFLNLKWAYHVVGAPHEATDHTIRKAYKDAIKIWHPDRHASNPAMQAEALEKTKALNAAYDQIRHAPLRYHISTHPRVQERAQRRATRDDPSVWRQPPSGARSRRYTHRRWPQEQEQTPHSPREFTVVQTKTEHWVRFTCGMLLGIFLVFLASHGIIFSGLTILPGWKLYTSYLCVSVVCGWLSMHFRDNFWRFVWGITFNWP